MGDEAGAGGIRRERLLLAATAAVAVLAPAAVWRIGRSGETGLPQSRGPATPDPTQEAARATRTARAVEKTAEARATPEAEPTLEGGKRRRRRDDGTPTATP